MQLSHTRPLAGAVLDDPNLVSAAGLVPLVALAERCGLRALADEHLSAPSDTGANADCKVTSLVAGDGRGRGLHRRHGFAASRRDVQDLRPPLPSTLGSFLRCSTYGTQMVI